MLPNGKHRIPQIAEVDETPAAPPPASQQPQGILMQSGQAVQGMIVFGPNGPMILETSKTNQGLALAQAKIENTSKQIRSILKNTNPGDAVSFKVKFTVEE